MLKERYGALIDDARTRWDVSFIISNLSAELSAGHTYTFGGDTEDVPRQNTGYLGIDWELDNGKYRILLAPDKEDREWPEAIRVGSGARTIALLDDVPIWFELWRRLNGFPPNYYQPENDSTKTAEK